MSFRRKTTFLKGYKQYSSEIYRYIALLAFPLVLGVVLFFVVNSVITRQINEQGRQIVRHFSTQTDSILRETEIVSDSIINDSGFYEFVNGMHEYESLDVCSLINKKVAESNYVSGAYFISESRNRIYSNYAYYSYEGLSAVLREFFPNLDESIPIGIDAIDTGWHLSEGNYGHPYYVADLNPGSETTEKLVININMRAFLKTINNPNTVLCCAFSDSVNFSSMLKNYPDMDWRSESAVAELVGTKVKCFYEEGDFFTYLVAVSTEEYYAPLNMIVYGFCAYFILVLLIGFAYLFSISRRRYHEFASMIDGLPQLTSNAPTFNDLISAVNNSLIEYKKDYDYQQRIVKRENLSMLISGELTKSAAEDQLIASGITPSKTGYYVAMASVDNSLPLSINSSSSSNNDVICLIFESALKILSGDRLSAAVTTKPTMPNFYFFILSIMDPELSSSELRELLKKMADAIETKYAIKASFTVSSFVNDASGLFDAYIECKKLSDFVHSVDSDIDVMFQDDMQNDVGVLLNGDFLNQLQILLRTLLMEKYELIPQLTNGLLSEHVAKVGKHYDLARDRLTAVTGILIDAVMSSDLSEDEKTIAATQLHRVKSISDLQNSAEQIFTSISKRTQETGIDPLVKKACAYIDENISDSMLSVPQISEAVNVSVQHLSRLFKRDMDNTIVEYINTRRIEIAKKLLVEENYTVSKIADYAGYNNTVTFTRNFKRYVGLSPSEYRSLNRM